MDPVGERDGRRTRHPHVPAAHARARRARSHPEHGVVTAFGGEGIYGTSKAAVLAISQSLHSELEPAGIGVTALCPGTISSQILGAQRNRPARFGRLANEPFGRITDYGLDPIHVGRRAVAAIRANELYTFRVSPKATSGGCVLDTKPASTTSSPPSIAARSRRSDDGSEGVAVGGQRGSNYYLTGIPDGPLPIVFEAGLPDPATFPAAELGRLFTDVLEADAAELQYGSPIDGDLGYGNIGLRRLLAQRTLEIDGRTVDHAGVMLTSGGVQGIAEAVAAFLEPPAISRGRGSTDVGLHAASDPATGAQATAIPIDDDGMQIDLLEQHIARLEAAGERLKLVYIIATFNVPTAVSLSEERRRRLVTLAQEHSFVIVEDNVYADLRYDGERLPSLYSLDDAGLVVKVDSFSKTLMPALRLGWVTGDAAAIDTIAHVRRDLGVSQLH